jgi:integrase
VSRIVKTPAGTWRANWRDPAGRQRAKTFLTKKAATAFLAKIASATNRGTYVDPHAGRQPFGPYARRWLEAQNVERTTADRDGGIMRNHVLPRWENVQLSRIDHSGVQAWVTELGTRRSPATVAECKRMLATVLRSAMRDRLIGANPCEGVRLPRRRKHDTDDQVFTRDEFARLVAATPDRYRALVGLSGCTGLRWGECIGLRWDSVDLDDGVVRVVRTATEVNGNVLSKPYPKSKAGPRTVPLPAYALVLLLDHARRFPPGPRGEVFTNSTGGPLRRSMFRTRTWRPALVRAGLLGKVVQVGEDRWKATWMDADGLEREAELRSERAAVAHVARNGEGGLRFHDLRHSYATWMVSDGVPINDLSRVMGHEQISPAEEHPANEEEPPGEGL